MAWLKLEVYERIPEYLWTLRHLSQCQLICTNPSLYLWWLRRQRICLQCGRPGFNPWVGKIPWKRKWQTHSSILAWRIPWKEEPGGLQSEGSRRVGHDWATKHSIPVHTWVSSSAFSHVSPDLTTPLTLSIPIHPLILFLFSACFNPPRPLTCKYFWLLAHISYSNFFPSGKKDTHMPLLSGLCECSPALPCGLPAMLDTACLPEHILWPLWWGREERVVKPQQAWQMHAGSSPISSKAAQLLWFNFSIWPAKQVGPDTLIKSFVGAIIF